MAKRWQGRKRLRMRVALIVSVATAYGRGVLRGVARYVRAHRAWALEPVPGWDNDFGMLRRWNGDGMIAQVSSHKLLSEIQARGRPCVNISDYLDGLPLPRVGSDNLTVGRMAAEHFLARGFTQFAFLGERGAYYSQRRCQGFQAAVSEKGFDCHVCELDGPETPGYVTERILTWAKELPKPVAVLMCNDAYARQVATLWLEYGLAVPEEMAVIGVDNDETLCDLGDIPFSSVAVDAESIGYEAAGLVDRMMSGLPVGREPILVPALKVVTRRSSDILAIEHPLVADAVRFISEHQREPITVADMVGEMSVSRRYLERLFRLHLRRTPAAEILRVHIERAKLLLRETDLPMERVAARAGFTDATHLGRCFRRVTGLSPNTFRRQRKIPGSPPSNGHQL